MNYKIIHFQMHGDKRGQLIALEDKKEIPFHIKRIYYMYGSEKGIRRGFHAHKSLTQILICIHGQCKIHLDDGYTTEEILLDDPSNGILIQNNLWREMYDFSSDAVLLVLASDYYDEKDYIRDHDDFINYIKNIDEGVK